PDTLRPRPRAEPLDDPFDVEQVERRATQRVGSILGELYELRGLIAVGGMGAIYEAWQRSPGRRVAVKILHSELVGSAEHVARFLRESRMASGLLHPNIVTVFDSGSASDGAPYLVTELLGGSGMPRET